MEFFVWTGFIIFFITIVLLDLGVFHRQAHHISFKKALVWTGFWITLAMLSNGVIYLLYENKIMTCKGEVVSGLVASSQFLSGYLLEYSLSMDNIFVIAMIITAFAVPPNAQHRLLFWGIFSAAVLRGIMIGLGATLIHHFHWMEYVFGAIVLFSAYKMSGQSEEELDPDQNSIVKIAKRYYNISSEYDGANFTTRLEGKFAFTPMFLALLMIEFCDVMFAFDSIPAIFSVTEDPFLVFSSNMFAILGLRSLYFALAGLLTLFKYLKYSLIVLLVFVGVKFMVHDLLPQDEQSKYLATIFSLSFICLSLFIGIIVSIMMKPRLKDQPTNQVENSVAVNGNEMNE